MFLDLAKVLVNRDETMEVKKEIPTPSLTPDLLSLPVEIFNRHIFPKMEYRDLLRLRRVCKPIKVYSDDFIRNNFKSQVREINETNYPLQHFLQANLPTTSIFINNSSPAFFEDPLIPQFLQLYGDQITHVRIHHFATFISPSELHFFANLPKLEHLDLDFIDATKRDCIRTIDKAAQGIKVPCEKSPFPENFKKLKTLKLNVIQGSQKNDLGYAWDFIEFCEKLEYVKHPLYKDKGKSEAGHPKGPFGCVMDYMKKRHLTNQAQPNLQFYDLEHQTQGGDYFGIKRTNLLGLCDYLKVKLLNVNGDLFVKGNAMLGYQVPFFPMPLVSLRNIHAFAFLAELPNLEKLVVESVGDSSFAETFRWSRTDGNMAPVEIPKWPKLELLDLMIDFREMSGDNFMPESLTMYFLRFLFGPGRKRDKLRVLALRFGPYLVDTVYDESQLPIPKVKDITASCPFVTKLTLTNWLGTNQAVTMFWKGLPLLEEVVLDKCEEISDVAFVGKQREDPVFLKLKYLKKLSLKGLDLMSDITDLAFNLVFRHLKIKEFYLTCEDTDMPYLIEVTAAGIESLLDGDFNNSVEKFPFDGWSLDEVSEEEFEKLKLKFRASHMI